MLKNSAQRNNWDFVPRKEADLTRARFRKVLRTQAKTRKEDKLYDLAAFSRSGELVGLASIMDVSRQLFQNAYLGYRIFNRHWANGYGKEMVRAVLDIGFRDIRIHRIEAGIEPANRRSHALARALGFRHEGTSRRRLFLRNKWVDLSLYALTVEDLGIRWRPRPQDSMLPRAR